MSLEHRHVAATAGVANMWVASVVSTPIGNEVRLARIDQYSHAVEFPPIDARDVDTVIGLLNRAQNGDVTDSFDSTKMGKPEAIVEVAKTALDETVVIKAEPVLGAPGLGVL
jgi:hypothetical protein